MKNYIKSAFIALISCASKAPSSPGSTSANGPMILCWRTRLVTGSCKRRIGVCVGIGAVACLGSQLVSAQDSAPAPAPQAASASSTVRPSVEELTKLKQNPVSGLKQIGLQTSLYPGFPDSGDTSGIYSLQVVWPFSLNEDYRLISYTIAPVIHLPATDGLDSETGLGNTLINLYVSPKKTGAWVWGLGPSVALPTRTDSELGSDRTSLGPAGILFYQQETWSAGVVVQNAWSLGGSDENKVNAFGAQYIFNYNLPDGWSLYSNSTITADWEATSSERWTVPVGGGVSRLFYAGEVPLELAFQSFYNVVAPEDGPDWSVNIQFSVILGAPE